MGAVWSIRWGLGGAFVALSLASCADQPSVITGKVEFGPTYASAAYWQRDDDARCTYGGHGACQVAVCRDVLEVQTIRYRAGHTTITNGSRTLVIDGDDDAPAPGPSGESGSPPAADPFYRAGELLTVRSVGGDVPPFSGTVRAPTDVMLTEPSAAALLSEPGAIPIERGRDLQLAWSGGILGTFVELIGVYAIEGNRSVSAVCRFDATNHRGVVPAAVLDAMRGGGTMNVVVRGRTSVREGSLRVELKALGRLTDDLGVVYPSFTFAPPR